MDKEVAVHENEEKGKNLEFQSRQVAKINAYFLQNPSLAVALLSGYMSLCGFLILWVVFYKEKINLIDYVSVGDFFFGVFAVDFALPLIISVIVVLFWGYFRLSKVSWTKMYKFWLIVTSYLIVAPLFPAYVWYKPLTVCHPDNTTYSVTYKLPTMNVEHDLVMVSSLSNYKVFKRHSPGCNVNFSEFTDADYDKDFQLVVIHDSAIAKIEAIKTKT
ncbi:hypothetical protein [Vibrio coralliilyticus]|uniref:hypothetical protein n=1 Tax=Vibrio coralliilyticus TaxID=190893 RepID=UPI000C169F9F|nr:hypothetical protein [Vibrio coralliilyticus]